VEEEEEEERGSGRVAGWRLEEQSTSRVGIGRRRPCLRDGEIAEALITLANKGKQRDGYGLVILRSGTKMTRARLRAFGGLGEAAAEKFGPRIPGGAAG